MLFGIPFPAEERRRKQNIIGAKTKSSDGMDKFSSQLIAGIAHFYLNTQHSTLSELTRTMAFRSTHLTGRL